MVDTNHPDEEYQLPGEEPEGTGSSYSTVVLPKRSMWLRNLLFIITVVLIGFAIYQFAGSFFSSEPIKQQKPIPVVTAPTPVPAATPTPVISSAETVAHAKKLDEISAATQQNKEDIGILKASIVDFKNNLSDIDSRFSDLNFTIQNLTKQVSQLQDQLNAFQKLYEEAHKKKQPKKAVELPKYFIEAIIPGRAWLKLKNDTRITVSQGDFITGYGVVTAINPESGTISTSSGRIIEYSPSDR
ncbi:MAG: hypothetical protein JSS53_09080 [Proteobacteria bacterium]|nr:hypothetical protein [Pseudomonadota bacterium]